MTTERSEQSEERHDYGLLTEDVHGFRENISYTGEAPKLVPKAILKGSLITVLRPSDIISIKEVHECLVNYKLDKSDTQLKYEVYLYAKSNYVYNLTQLEREFMLGVKALHSRIRMLKKLKWIVSLEKNSEVCVTIANIPDPVRSVVRYIGGLSGEIGRQFGIEILEKRGQGTNDGTFKGTEFFKCKKDCVVFVAMDKLSEPPTAKAAKSNESAFSFVGTPFKVEDKVFFFDNNSQKHKGTVRWMGINKIDGATVVGIEADEHLTLFDIPHHISKMKGSFAIRDSRHSKVLLPNTFVHRDTDTSKISCNERKNQTTESASLRDKSTKDHLASVSKKGEDKPSNTSNRRGSSAKQDVHHLYDSIPGDQTVDVVIPQSENPHNFEVGSLVKYLGCYGVIKWIGSLPGSSKVQSGVELFDDVSGASTDGTWIGCTYFKCNPLRGKFMLLASLEPDKNSNPYNLKVGSNIQYSDPPQYGVIKWMGKLPTETQIYAGTEMEEDIDEANDGVWAGDEYFKCKPNRGMFVLLRGLQPSQRTAKLSAGPSSQPASRKNSPLHSNSRTTSESKVPKVDVDDAQQIQNPHKFEEGSTVQYGDPPQYGIIKWVGVLPDHVGMLFAGLDMEEVVDNYTDGKFKGVQYFKPQPGRGKFIRLAELQLDQRFIDVSTSVNPAASNITSTANKNESAASFSTRISDSDKSTVSNSSSSHDDSSKFEVGSMVTCGNPPLFGVIRWIGIPIGCDEQYAGLEMDDYIKNYTDGNWGGEQHFQPPPGKGLFVPVAKLRPDDRFALKAMQENPLKVYQMTIEGPIIPQTTLIPDKHTGLPKGIQGQHNSCYLDATLYGMFAFSDAFDGVFLGMENGTKRDGDQEIIPKIIQKQIVYPLRHKYVVPQETIFELRENLDRAGKGTGLLKEEKDPEEFLNILFKHVLSVEPYLTITRHGRTEKEFFMQLFLEPDTVVLPNTQSLLHKMFMKEQITFENYPTRLLLQIPRYGKAFKVFEKVIPSLEMDVNALCNILQPCLVCGEDGNVVCEDCRNEKAFAQDKMYQFFCENCSKSWHSHGTRQNHKPWSKQNCQSFATGTLQLLSVLCIETSHYVCFTRIMEPQGDKWVCFDSMAERPDDEYNRPKVVHCTDELQKWVYGKKDVINTTEKLPELACRFVRDGYLCIYVDKEGTMYK